MIVERQKGASWGKSVIEHLAGDLQAEFPGTKGFSVRNLWNMRGIFTAYRNQEKLQPLVAEIGWTKNLVILEKCKDHREREFYLQMTKRLGWTKPALIQHIKNRTFERTLSNQTNFEKTLPPEISKQARLAVKDEYSFDFLELGDEFSERQLESAILSRVVPFLQEMGGLYTAVAVPSGTTTVYFEYEAPPEPTLLSGTDRDFFCAEVVKGTITFEALAQHYFRPSIVPNASTYEVTLYNSINSNGVPASPYAASYSITEVNRHCRYYPFCSVP